ncbi:methyl-accepting chemotaxis protein [Domibacillus tundrae]|uniref:methyl-accepting chemotaxis protein n=1 Tax=Domibacillus tundrae TaxID=1587527 RepID=UPI0033912A91
MKRKKTTSLKRTVIGLIFVLMIGLFIAASSFMYVNIKKAIDETVRESTILHADRIADSIDPDVYAAFLENPEKNDTYEQLRVQLNEYREKIGAMYVYTLQADDNESLAIIIDGMASTEDTVDIGEPTTATTYKDVESVFNGNTAATDIVSDPDYGDYMSAFAPIKDQNGTIIGVLGVDMEANLVKSIAKNVLNETIPVFVIGLLAVLAAVLAILYVFLTKRLNPLAKLNEASALIAEGKIGQAKQKINSLRVTSNDEIGVLSGSIRNMIDTLESMLQDIQAHSADVKQQSDALNQTSHDMKESSSQIAVTMEEMATAVEQQAQATGSISDEMNRFSTLISAAVQQGDAISGSSNVMMNRTNKGEALMSSSIGQMDETYTMVQQSVQKVKELETKTNEVHTLVSFISGVADQTNLLALNAAIEAARAGEAGKGFAVVADEVRKLSDQVSKSVQDIQRIVQSVNHTTNEVAAFLEQGLKQVSEGKNNLSQTGEAFQAITGEIHSMDSLIKQMQERLQDVLARQGQMTNALSDVASISEESAAGIEEVTATAEQMTHLAYTTQDQVGKLHDMSAELDQLNRRFTF